ncbi:MAG: hypothetical protein H0T76_10690, partial [Nannocystis sp.]
MLLPRPLSSTILSALLLLACDSRPAASGDVRAREGVVTGETPIVAAASATPATLSPVVAPVPVPVDIAGLKAGLLRVHGEAQRDRIERGVDQVVAMWRPEDGDLAAFVTEFFIGDPALLDATFARLEAVFEQIEGHIHEVGREVRRASDVDVGPLLAVDPLLAAYDPGARMIEDLFTSKVGFVVLLNFPLTTLAERDMQGPGYTRREWAERRLASRFGRRVPGEVRQAVTKASAEADRYVSQYNLWMHHLVDARGARPFPAGLRLISHWNLRDELKGRYGDPEGLARQRLIVTVMERIVTQTIPAAVIDNPRVDWDPVTNVVTAAPADSIEADAPTRVVAQGGAREDDARYAMLLAQFHAARREDPFVPFAPTAIARSFEIGRELPEARVKALLELVLTSPLVPKVAEVIEGRLGRPLEPIDLWYPGFKASGAPPEAELDARTRALPRRRSVRARPAAIVDGPRLRPGARALARGAH